MLTKIVMQQIRIIFQNCKVLKLFILTVINKYIIF